MARLPTVLLSALAVLALHTPVRAQNYPSKPITIVVSLAAGSGMDMVTRLYAEKLSQALGKPVIVENKPGAATTLAAHQVAKAPADGHTLVVLTSIALSINPTLYKHLDYEPEDFVPISLYVKSPFILTTNTALPAKTVPEFIKLAKESNPPLSYASIGAGSLQQMSMEFAKKRFGFEATHVPYRSTAQLVTDLTAGHVAASFVEAGLDPADQGRQAARARGVGVAAAAAAARCAAVLRSRRRAGLRGRVLAHAADAGEDAEADRRSAACRDETDHGRAGHAGKDRGHRPHPERLALDRRDAQLHPIRALEMGRAGQAARPRRLAIEPR
jgi:tripartite-type tricarboxylate transporter receptor subunit TctC